MASRLRIAVPEHWERWAERSYRFRRDPERPQTYEDAIRLPVGAGRLWLPSGHIALPPMRGGARLFDDASFQYLENDSAPVTAAPFTMASWFRSNDATVAQAIMFLGDKDSDLQYWLLRASGATANDPLTFELRAGGGGLSINSGTGYTANVWAHACVVETSATDHSVFIDGGSEGASGLSKEPTGADRISLGRFGGSTPPASGRTART